MNDLFRFPEAVPRDAAVDAWFDERQSALGALARNWFERLRTCGPDVRELVHDGCPVACVEDAPFGYVNAFANHVNVGFFHGSALPDPERLLEGSGKRMRHVKLRVDREVNADALEELIAAAYADIKQRLAP